MGLMQSVWRHIPDLCMRTGSGYIAVGMFSHSDGRIQQNAAQGEAADGSALFSAGKRCHPSVMLQSFSTASHLFQSLDLDRQVRDPIRGLPAFFRIRGRGLCGTRNLHPRCAKACQSCVWLRQFAAQSMPSEQPSLRFAPILNKPLGQSILMSKGTWLCRQRQYVQFLPSAAGLLRAGRQPGNRWSMAPAQGHSARCCWTGTPSPAPLSVPQRTSSSARKTPVSADGACVNLALTFRSHAAGTFTTLKPRPGLARRRLSAFRPGRDVGPTRAQGTANV